MPKKNLMAAILAAINAYINAEQKTTKRPGTWAHHGRILATRNHLQWAARNRR